MNAEEKEVWCKSKAKGIVSLKAGSGFEDMENAFDRFVTPDCRILSLGESSHGCYEQTQFRVRLLEYLVEKKGFSAFVMESGFLEGLLVDRFIQGDESVTLKEALLEGITHYMGRFEEVKEIVLWMKQYNSTADYHKKLHFYGMDNTFEGDGLLIPFHQFVKYVKGRNDEFFQSVNEAKELEQLIQKSHSTVQKFSTLYQQRGCKIEPDFLNIINSMSYSILSETEKNRITELTKLIETRIGNSQLFDKMSYVRCIHILRTINLFKNSLDLRVELNSFVSTDRFKELVVKHNIMLEEYEKKFLDGLSFDKSSKDDWDRYFRSTNPREEIMVYNMNHITRIHSKVMITAHNTHITKGSVNTGFFDIPTMGVGCLLHKEYGKKYIAAGSSHDIFSDWEGQVIKTYLGKEVQESESCESLEKYLSKVDMDMFFISWSHDDEDEEVRKKWLELEMPLRYLQEFKVGSPAKCFDGYFFTKKLRFGKKVEFV